MSVHNFADDNTLSLFAKFVTLLMEMLMTESQNAIKSFSENQMIVKPDKFKSIVIHKSSQTSKQFSTGKLRQKYPNTELFLVRIFLHSD